MAGRADTTPEQASNDGAIDRALDDLRHWIASRIRGGVIGDDDHAAERRQQLFDADGPRWFAEGSAIHQVHGDSSMFVGGLRALLLQSLHPLAMAGVARHSNYREDPWGRLQRTADFLAATTFGPADEAERAVAVVKKVHERVTGVAADGRPYSANDPHLMRWVHITEVDSFLVAHRRYGETRLTDDGYDEYVAQMAVVARALGVPAPPESVGALRDQLRSFRGEVAGTPEARDAARYLLLQPPMHPAARPVYSLIAAAAVELLPRWARRPLRLPWLPVTEAVAVRPAGEAVTRTLRWALRAPEPVPG